MKSQVESIENYFTFQYEIVDPEPNAGKKKKKKFPPTIDFRSKQKQSSLNFQHENPCFTRKPVTSDSMLGLTDRVESLGHQC